MKWIFIYIVAVVHLFVYGGANLHTFGRKDAYGTRRIYHRTLIDDANKFLTDYTLILKCIGYKYEEISYLQIDVNADSTGYINESNGNKDFQAKIEIKNAFNVTATIEVFMSLQSELISRFQWIQETGRMKHIKDSQLDVSPYERSFRNDNEEKYYGKSLTFIYKKNSQKSLEPKPLAQDTIGRRRKGDELLHFESRNLTHISRRFPSRVFEYSGREYITYVGFSFNSPTAMVMINTSYVGEQEFNAVAYDMNTEHFVANMSVYGIRSELRPANFVGLM